MSVTIIESRRIFEKWKEADKSFMKKPSLLQTIFGTKSYSEIEVRQIWHDAVKCGIGIGLDHASSEGRNRQLMSSATSEKHKEFLRKHYELLKEYGCAIQFNADEGGMCIIDASHRQPNRVAVMHPKLVTDDDRWDVEWRTANK